MKLSVTEMASVTARMPGWLQVEALDLTIRILAQQDLWSISGPVLELGIFKGRYLSVLHAGSADAGSKVFGVDGFLVGLEGMTEEIKTAWVDSINHHVSWLERDTSRLKIISSLTTELNSKQLLDYDGGKKFRFISVDAGHDADNVHYDLKMVAPVLAEGGVVALDDAFNEALPGVAEGLFRFFAEGAGGLAAFCSCGNKLFMTQKEQHGRWRDWCIETMKEAEVPYMKNSYTRWKEYDVTKFHPEFFGLEVVPFIYGGIVSNENVIDDHNRFLQEKANLEEALSRYRAHVEAIENSLSFRMTRPLAKLKGLLSRSK